ncbi:hypothetical protein [Zobellia alginiliquefaciens]|uniref:hypothetical protein n=1 Tax=Zobellia alginiliquefaciens TaxID=3032586 RepID=UPI0023E470AB|nr:hypothetical protein [Zobellia alginiliquefaciens]
MYSLLFQFFINGTKASFWLVLAVFFFSNSGVSHKLSSSFALENTHSVHSSAIKDSVTRILEESLVFELSTKETRKGVTFTNIKVKADPNMIKGEQLFEIYISKPTQDINALLGRHEITGNFNSLLRGFDGVFGFINVTDLDEKPYFSYKGAVHITTINPKAISGSLNMSFKNYDGIMVHINQHFRAYK